MPASPDARTSLPSATPASGRGIDPRGPRFGAAITAVLLLIDVYLDLVSAHSPAIALLALITALFAWGAFAGVQRHPYGLLYRHLIRPRLSAPSELEDPAAPTFAQAVGFVITLAGLVLALIGVPVAVPAAATAAFVAAFLNSVFGYCLGCQLYLLLLRARLIKQPGASRAA